MRIYFSFKGRLTRRRGKKHTTMRKSMFHVFERTNGSAVRVCRCGVRNSNARPRSTLSAACDLDSSQGNLIPIDSGDHYDLACSLQCPAFLCSLCGYVSWPTNPMLLFPIFVRAGFSGTFWQGGGASPPA